MTPAAPPPPARPPARFCCLFANPEARESRLATTVPEELTVGQPKVIIDGGASIEMTNTISLGFGATALSVREHHHPLGLCRRHAYSLCV